MRPIFKATTTIAILSLAFLAFAPAVFAELSGGLSVDRTKADLNQAYKITINNPTVGLKGATLNANLKEKKDNGQWMDLGGKSCLTNDFNRCSNPTIIEWNLSRSAAGTYTYYAVLSDGSNTINTGSGTVVVGQVTPTTPPTTPPGPVSGESLPGPGAPKLFGITAGGTELRDFIVKIGDWIFIFLIAVASVFLIVAGFLHITAAGEQEKITKAREMLTNAIIGVVIALLARGIVQVLQSIIGTGTGA